MAVLIGELVQVTLSTLSWIRGETTETRLPGNVETIRASSHLLAAILKIPFRLIGPCASLLFYALLIFFFKSMGPLSWIQSTQSGYSPPW